jgi:hypothetical protein
MRRWLWSSFLFVVGGCGTSPAQPTQTVLATVAGLAFRAQSVSVSSGESASSELRVDRAPSDSVFWTHRDVGESRFVGAVQRISNSQGRIVYEALNAPVWVDRLFVPDERAFTPLAVSTRGTVLINARASNEQPLARGEYVARVAVGIVAATNPRTGGQRMVFAAHEFDVRFTVR